MKHKGTEAQRKREEENFRITHYPLSITDYPLPITHYRLPITDYRLPITHYPLPNVKKYKGVIVLPRKMGKLNHKG